MKYKDSFIGWLLLLFISQACAENILNRGNGSEPDSLNIHLAEGLNSHNILRDLYEGLMTLDAYGKPIYGMAVSHEVNHNVWTFKLRKEAQWSDGSHVVASDFVRAWRLAIDPKTAASYAFLMDNIVNAKKISRMQLTPEHLAVKAIDDYTLEISLEQTDAAFLEKLSLPIFYPQAKTKNIDRKIVSNGAYQLKDWTIQEKIIIVKNSYYYDKDNVYYDTVNYWVTEDQSSELKRFRARELDITESIPDSQIKWIEQNLRQELHIAPYLGSFFLGLNLENKYLKNHKLRQALSLAINREILTAKVLKTGQKPAYHIIPRDLVFAPNKSSIVNHSDRAHQAQKLLKQSGINVDDLKLEILYNNSENQRKIVIAIAAMWRQTLGIKTRLVNQEWKVFVQSRKSATREVFRSGWIADYADVLSFLELFVSDSRFNFYRYKNPKFDALVIKISKTTDENLKNHLIEQAENMLLDDLPVIPLYYYVSRHLVNNKVSGYVDNVSDRHLSKYLYQKEDEK